ncbi:hypothetical protein PF002_g10706 [Phytophthora fragariae]|uniref:RxLR effector protein n=3 Tax=Phytophthora fragariae TaxID=53985 RepID=A0A6A3T586_9STRA|nr:hypothetical protein PF003_g22132 [Phytophthora fragariae]KAE8939430.1 hypothetical protein PF009_g10717 [Phytophthora fragariae]KAE9129786.1 hypothetical protein PF006_g15921 [Phytophthora fragariae]KAE9237055.1 hypothetical protein PF004_g8676 [Phytophthora fragariae]KAE9238241.1 hypothetical protein PF002_g10706 [Phytophthora fragariae]
MRGCIMLVVVGASLLATCRAVTGPEQLEGLQQGVSSDRLLQMTPDKDDGTADEDDTDERAIDPATVAKMRAELEAIDTKLNFRDWFRGGATIEQVRSFLGLPAKGEAVGHANWAQFQSYLKYVHEMDVKAANAAKVAAIKQKLTFRGWYLERKSIPQVRKILGLPAKGPAVDNPNWETFQAYLKFVTDPTQLPHRYP